MNNEERKGGGGGGGGGIEVDTCCSERSTNSDKLMGKPRQASNNTQELYVAPMAEQHV